jgi:hypothetical protein
MASSCAGDLPMDSSSGSMRDFGTVCGEESLQVEIGELNACGFANDSTVAWKGDAFWAAFKQWLTRENESHKSEIGERPDLYQN